MEISVVNHSTDIEELLSNRVLDFGQFSFYVKICMFLYELLHGLVHLCLRVIRRIFLQVLGCDTGNHVFNIGIKRKAGAELTQSAFH